MKQMGVEMDWQQKAEALNALGEIQIMCRKAGDWWVRHPGVEIGDGHMLTSGHRDGASPVSAIEAHWNRLTDELKPDEFLVINAMNDSRRQVRWNGYMWKDVPGK